MPLRRSQITMSDAEMLAFLHEERVVTCATVGPGGRPHLMPLWYVVEDGRVTAWTFGKSQKVRNLERLPQADARRYRLIDERVERRRADDLQHVVAFSFVGSDVAGLKSLGVEGVHYLGRTVRRHLTRL